MVSSPNFAALFSRLHNGLVTAGVRFTTLPDATPPSYQLPEDAQSTLREPAPTLSQPPTTITALFNPIIGHITGAYTARVSRDLSMCSRFDFNVYSYESEWTIGAEWWTRRRTKPAIPDPVPVSVREDTQVLPDTAVPDLPPVIAPSLLPPPLVPVAERSALEDINGVVKAKMSTSTVRTINVPRYLVTDIPP